MHKSATRVFFKTVAFFLTLIFIFILILLIFTLQLYDYEVIEEIPSPDGKYIAVVFEGNSGATSNYTYRLSVLKNGETINKLSRGNTLITNQEFSVIWIDDQTLQVNNSIANVFKQEYEVMGVVIEYNYQKSTPNHYEIPPPPPTPQPLSAEAAS